MFKLDFAPSTTSRTQAFFPPLFDLGTFNSGGIPIYIGPEQRTQTQDPGFEISNPVIDPETGEWIIPVENISEPKTVKIGNRVYVRAKDPDDIQPGEFVWDALRRVLRLKPLLEEVVVLPVLVIGLQAQFGTLQLKPPFPWWFLLIENFSCSLAPEQQPTGSIQFACPHMVVDDLLETFRQDTRFKVFDIGFRVVSVQYQPQSIIDNPLAVHTISVSLTGWTEADLTKLAPYRTSSYIEPERSFESQSSLEPFRDPDCTVVDQTATANLGSDEVEVSLQTLFNRIGVKLNGPTFKIPVPPEATRLDGVDVMSELQPFLRPKGLFLDLFGDEVWTRESTDSRQWLYSYTDSLLEPPQINYQGTVTKSKILLTQGYDIPDLLLGGQPQSQVETYDENQRSENPDLIGIAVAYTNQKVTTAFDASGNNIALKKDPYAGAAGKPAGLEQQQQEVPKFKPREPVKRTTTRGDDDVDAPPSHYKVIRDLALNAHMSGETKTKESETSEDGFPIERILEVWGCAYLSSDVTITDGEGKVKIAGTPQTYWRMVRYEKTTFTYTSEGYPDEENTVGWEYRPMEDESLDSKTSLGDEYKLMKRIENATDPTVAAQLQAERSLYQFRQMPLKNKKKHTYADFTIYPDAQDPNAGKIPIKKCHPNGLSSTVYVDNPAYVTPRWLQRVSTANNTFFQVPDPRPPEKDAQGNAGVRPPLTSGRYSENDVEQVPEPAKDPKNDFLKTNTRDYSAEGPRLVNTVERRSFAESFTRVSAASAKPPLLEQLEEEGPTEEEILFGKGLFAPADNTKDWYIYTEPFNYSDPINGSLDYPKAKNIMEFKTAAELDLLINHVRAGGGRQMQVQVPFNPRIRPLDKLDVLFNQVLYKSYVDTVNWNFTARGILDGNLLIDGTCSLTLASDKVPEVKMHWRNKPGLEGVVAKPVQRDPNDPGDPGDPSPGKATLARDDLANLPGRGNY